MRAPLGDQRITCRVHTPRLCLGSLIQSQPQLPCPAPFHWGPGDIRVRLASQKQACMLISVQREARVMVTQPPSPCLTFIICFPSSKPRRPLLCCTPVGRGTSLPSHSNECSLEGRGERQGHPGARAVRGPLWALSFIPKGTSSSEWGFVSLVTEGTCFAGPVLLSLRVFAASDCAAR